METMDNNHRFIQSYNQLKDECIPIFPYNYQSDLSDIEYWNLFMEWYDNQSFYDNSDAKRFNNIIKSHLKYKELLSDNLRKSEIITRKINSELMITSAGITLILLAFWGNFQYKFILAIVVIISFLFNGN